jgi:hypothetical protein
LTSADSVDSEANGEIQMIGIFSISGPISEHLNAPQMGYPEKGNFSSLVFFPKSKGLQSTLFGAHGLLEKISIKATYKCLSLLCFGESLRTIGQKVPARKGSDTFTPCG